jgi:16S rRNA (adenine1518-N6/adenine1519-N6)-dimethyltransferase
MNPKALLEQHGLSPKKSLGQNFLHDPNALEKIVATAELMPTDTVVEIGPGTGALTAYLARAAKHVISIELDERMRPVLEQTLAPYPNVAIIWDDVLNVDLLQVVGPKDFVVVANVPYYITSQILRHVLENDRRPRRVVMTVQLEVAERVAARVGDMSLLTVSVQFYGKPSLVSKLNPAVFWPRPDVESALLRIDTYDKPPVDVPDSQTFFRVVRAGFSQKRKQLKNALSGGLAMNSNATTALLEAAGIDVKRRAETLSLEEWAALTRAYVASKQP